jgi:hydrogenase nickel incorporation protein HypA/HybF
MHEMALAASLLTIVRQEMEKHRAKRLLLVRVRCGILANVAPEALSMAFEVQTNATSLAGAKLELQLEPLHLRCGGCAREFFQNTATRASIFSACPACGEEIGHTILAGKELYIEHIELE